jgi:hypothetical protein
VDDEVVREHVRWALVRAGLDGPAPPPPRPDGS